jgi:hypothetical protein
VDGNNLGHISPVRSLKVVCPGQQDAMLQPIVEPGPAVDGHVASVRLLYRLYNLCHVGNADLSASACCAPLFALNCFESASF